jgi:hypothetical protein
MPFEELLIFILYLDVNIGIFLAGITITGFYLPSLKG